MGSVGNALISGIDPATIVETVDGLYAYEMTVVSWAIVVRSQLEGPAAYLLGEELDKLVESSLGHARSLAERSAQLGGAVTADPSGFVARSPLNAFDLPANTGEPDAVLGYALDQVRRAIRAYGGLVADVAGRDVLTYHLLLTSSATMSTSKTRSKPPSLGSRLRQRRLSDRRRRRSASDPRETTSETDCASHLQTKGVAIPDATPDGPCQPPRPLLPECSWRVWSRR